MGLLASHQILAGHFPPSEFSVSRPLKTEKLGGRAEKTNEPSKKTMFPAMNFEYKQYWDMSETHKRQYWDMYMYTPSIINVTQTLIKHFGKNCLLKRREFRASKKNRVIFHDKFSVFFPRNFIIFFDLFCLFFSKFQAKLGARGRETEN